MASLLLRTVGTALGGSIGGLLGAAVGGIIDRSIFFGNGGEREGPRLDDLSVQSSALGSPIPLVFGTARVAGNVLWSSGLIEKRTQSKQSSGGKGAKSTSTVEFSYSVSMAVGLSARPIIDIGRIWADGKLLRDQAGAWLSPARLRVYRGLETQEPDPLIEAHEGVANAPAFRGLAYAVLEGLELAEFANRAPNLSFEVMADEGLTSGRLLQQIGVEAGMRDIAHLDMDQPITGLAVARDIAARAAMEGVLALFPASASEGSGRLGFRGLLSGDERTVPRKDLGTAATDGSGDRFSVRIEREQGADLWQEMAVRYGDPQRDFQPSVQRARRQQSHTERRFTVDSPLFVTADRAKKQAELLLALSWMKQENHQLLLPSDYATLEVGDRIVYPVDGRMIRLLITEMTIAADHVEVTAHPIGPLPDLVLAGAASGTFTPPVVLPVGSSLVHLLDLPGLGFGSGVVAGTPRLLAAMAGPSPGWRGGSVYLSRDQGENYDLITSSRASAIIGETVTTLPAGTAVYWDEHHELFIRLVRPDMALESRSALAVLNGANVAVVGDEIIQFRNARLEPDGRYRLSGLLRGRNGTEWAMPGHQAGERFILLDGGALLEIEAPVALIGQSTLIKAVSVNAALDDMDASVFSYGGRALMPLAPVHVRGQRLPNLDLAIQWLRRTRVGGDWLDGRDVPLGEEAEGYELDILLNGVRLRTLSTSTPSLIYSLDQQMADFGSPQSRIEIALYQMSATVGRGFAASGFVEMA
ncbi:MULTISPECIES: phage tail protein [unclassified Iodidimonas]|jgi:hypothetical protein|uniref:phage tail protein n=1 Tax=unclassified Iodidimonas TaxID=2626145 RepID=UPI002482D2BB|nr:MULTISPECIES: phage tail protein [unclassified Iodidimonas]